MLLAAIGWMGVEGRPLPRLIALPTYGVSSNIAALHAWMRALGKQGTALWEPTRRGGGEGKVEALTSHTAGQASRPA